MKRFLVHNIEFMVGIISLIIIYFVVYPIIGLFYPVAPIPPEMILKPFYWAFEFCMAVSIISIVFKVIQKVIADYIDPHDYNKKLKFDFTKDFENSTPEMRMKYSLIMYAILVFLFSMIALCGVLS